jgi:hypothetical protein
MAGHRAVWRKIVKLVRAELGQNIERAVELALMSGLIAVEELERVGLVRELSEGSGLEKRLIFRLQTDRRGENAMSRGISSRGSFAFGGYGATGAFGVGSIGGDLFECCHFGFIVSSPLPENVQLKRYVTDVIADI